MSRGTAVYFVMLVVCVGGLWLILRAGAGLAAPTDLSGVWAVGGEDASVPRDLGGVLHIEQSGRYFRLKFERGLQLDLELLSETRPDGVAGDGLALKWEGGPWSLSANGTNAAGPLIFRLTGPASHTFAASRDPGAARVSARTQRLPLGFPPRSLPRRRSLTVAAPFEIAATAAAQIPTADAGAHAR